MPTASILIIEDEERMRRVLELVLKPEHYDLLRRPKRASGSSTRPRISI